MKVLFAGSPGIATSTLQAIYHAGHDVVGVLTQPPKPYGRKKDLQPTPVSDLAEMLGLPVFTPSSGAEILEIVQELNPEIGIVVAYGKILNEDVIAAVPGGLWNVHFSLLPRWRGANPVAHAISAGDRETGITLFNIVPELDAGPIVLTHAVPIEPHDTSGGLLDKLSEVPPVLVTRFLHRCEKNPLPTRPQEGEVTYAPKIVSGAGALDLAKEIEDVYRDFRVHTPEPGAFVVREDTDLRVKILSAWADASKQHVEAGLVVRKTTGILIGTGSAPLIVQRVQPHGKNPMQADEWFRGLPPQTRMHVGRA